MQAIWGDIWKYTVEKSQTNATNVTLHHLKQAIWGHIWKHTVAKSQTSVANVITHPLVQAIWEHIWKYTVGKTQNQYDYAIGEIAKARNWMSIQ